MDINFFNIGTIKETNLKLKPFTVIIGPNNSNKTYLAYSLYGLLKTCSNLIMYDEDVRKYSTKNNFYFLNSEERKIVIEINRNLNTLLKRKINSATNRFRKSLTNYFQDTSGKLFTNSEYQIRLDESDLKKNLRMIKGNHKYTYYEEGPEQEIKYKLHLNNSTLSILFDDTLPQNLLLDEIFLSEIVADVFDRLFDEIFPRSFLLPAERMALILSYKLLANRRFKMLREKSRAYRMYHTYSMRQMELFREQGEIGYPRPIEDFLDFLIDLEFLPSNRILMKKKNKFQIMADEIEHYIQNDNRTSLIKTKLGGYEIKVAVKKGLTIDLYNASSSIRQLAPLILYLRYRARENDLLIIDEPEMNLHPLSQAKFLEILTMLVNMDVNVLITSHSPYLMSHLNNLVVPNKKDKNLLKKASQNLYLKNQLSFLNIDDINAYELKQNKLNSLIDENFGIRWDTLGDVSADVQQKYFKITETLDNQK